MRTRILSIATVAIGVIILLAALIGTSEASPIYTTHFFDWYQVNQQHPFSYYQRQWTYHPEWQRYGIQPAEIGNTEHYYAVQMRMIQKAGFDGIHYEWFGQQPSSAFIDAIKATHTKVAMFYDMEIRHGSAANYIQPTDAFRQFVIHDVASFYDRIPRNLWLHEGDGALPIIFYAYQFDTAYNTVSVWDHFYRTLLSGLEKALGNPVHIYWTSTDALPQIYAFQHFPQINSYTFGWWGGQTQIGAKSVTLIASYDDAGAVVGGRPTRTVNDDLRYLEDDYRLAELSNPQLVFNYGWNEFYEGEHIFPDTTWSDWRYRALSAIVKRLKAEKSLNPLPKAVIIADDLFPDSLAHPNPWYDSERNLLSSYRYLFPQAKVILPSQASLAALKEYRIIISMDIHRSRSEQAALIHLAQGGKRSVLFFEPSSAADNALTSRFTSGRRIEPLKGTSPPPGNQWVGAMEPVNVDPNKYPFIHIQVRNSLNTFYMVRFQGVDAQGNVYENHDNGSPLDWQVSGNRWVERTGNAKEILEAFAHKPIVKITGIVLIVNATGVPGDFHGDFAKADFTDAQGDVGARVNFSDAKLWQYRSSFQNGPLSTWPQGSLKILPENGGTLHLSLHARYNQAPVDTYSQTFPIKPGVRVLSWSSWMKIKVPLVLQRGNLYWVNSASPASVVYRPLMAHFEMPAPIQPEFKTFSEVKGVVAASVTTNPAPAVILHPAELPLSWVRMVHPPNFPVTVSYPFPVTSRPLAEVLVKSGAPASISVVNLCKASGAVDTPGTVTLGRGEVVDFYRLPVRIQPIGRSSGEVRVQVSDYSSSGAQLELTGHGEVEAMILSPGLRLLEGGRTAPKRLRLPCRLMLKGRLPWHSTPWRSTR